MLEFHEARRRLLALGRVLPAERVEVRRATGRDVAHATRSAVDIPGFDNSAMDGYALQAPTAPTDTISLPVVGESRAGAPGAALTPGTAMRIFTGAALPHGADAVVLQEDVVRQGSDMRFSATACRPGQHVRRRGEDVRHGEVVIEAGTRLSAFHLSLLLSLEQVVVEVVRQPRITILCTGDELRHPGSLGASGSLPESNGVALASLCEAAGAFVSLGPLVADELPMLTELLADAVSTSDIVVTVGGVSVGDYDVVRDAMAAAGIGMDFWKVKMRPGKPLAVGTHGRAVVLGLPGNPVSAQVTACLYLVPLIRTLQGDARAVAPFRPQRLTHDLTQSPGRRGFYRARSSGDQVTPQARQGSGSVVSMAQANALVTLHEDSAGAAAGEMVETLCFNEL